MSVPTPSTKAEALPAPPKKSAPKKSDEADEGEEPTVRKDAAEKGSVPKRGNLASIVDNWDPDDE